ncbi:hypothetical protein INT45_013877 [Circinella minor]|uniref:PiggyBac transposable element-derived protein domain-containing protein n=1 Tax=Circinella minor TaxID=1195481 RepID=A0A8H7V499_9FUNG|nr:hypothetical protein INT45_013877 [Circinella minor]
MPNIQKIPCKLYPVGQEYKTVADTMTCCIIRLDFTCDKLKGKFDDQHKAKAIASVARLTEPWHNSGRTIIADSWFGSLAMVRDMKNYHRLFSIMQVKKRLYYPKGMPKPDILQQLDKEFGRTLTYISLKDDVFVTALRDLKPKLVIANCSVTSVHCIESEKIVHRLKDGNKISRLISMLNRNSTLLGAVDTANNRQNNLLNFHDVMKTC